MKNKWKKYRNGAHKEGRRERDGVGGQIEVHSFSSLSVSVLCLCVRLFFPCDFDFSNMSPLILNSSRELN